MIPESTGIPHKTAQVLLTRIAAYPDIETATLFGSRATGSYRPGSDIDLAISGPACTIQTARNLASELNEHAPIAWHVDVVALEHLKNARLAEAIRKDGVVIFRRGNG